MPAHIPRSFLTGDSPFIPIQTVAETDARLRGEFAFELRHEGFIGIPHGGLGMGLCFDAWRRFAGTRYPVRANFKFGGSGVSIGDPVEFHAERTSDSGNDPRLSVSLIKTGDRKPYLKADLGAASDEAPAVGAEPGALHRDLPYYRNCFVCGHHREIPGLQRRFRVHSSNGSICSTARWQASDDDLDRARHFLIDENELHPAALTSIFDENTAWAGFMTTRAGALSVRMSLTLLRPVSAVEPILFVGRPAGVRGNPRSPRFFLADGIILSITDPAAPEPVAFGSGEWIILEAYTNQIKQNLLPEDDWRWVFDKEREVFRL